MNVCLYMRGMKSLLCKKEFQKAKGQIPNVRNRFAVLEEQNPDSEPIQTFFLFHLHYYSHQMLQIFFAILLDL